MIISKQAENKLTLAVEAARIVGTMDRAIVLGRIVAKVLGQRGVHL